MLLKPTSLEGDGPSPPEDTSQDGGQVLAQLGILGLIISFSILF
jgi:hypothetical protein